VAEAEASADQPVSRKSAEGPAGVEYADTRKATMMARYQITHSGFPVDQWLIPNGTVIDDVSGVDGQR
jgi:hypothetical protein